MYVYTYTGDDNEAVESKTAKGVPYHCKNRKLQFSDYERSLREGIKKTVEYNQIRSFNHQLYTIATRKVALSHLDNKRWICDDGIHTLAHGHYDAK